MLRHWLLTLAIVCGLLAAPLTMASERVQPAGSRPTVSHCADMADGEGGSSQHAPAKQFRCMGACSGVEAGVACLPARIMPAMADTAIPTMSSLGGILIEHELPPPRRA